MDAMMAASDATNPATGISWTVEARTLDGQAESGDLHLVEPFPGGVLVAVIDGLGHGSEAAVAARAAASCLALNAGRPVEELVARCHMALRRTRGAVMSLASIDPAGGTMSWLGVGNVEGVLFRADPSAMPPREAIIARGGIVGYQVPTLRQATVTIAPGDTMVLATDGVHAGFAGEAPLGRMPSDLARAIIAQYHKRSDDALVLVARFEGASS
jgi:negative regulator of sigma-B (phosphoserine phosphatase)